MAKYQALLPFARLLKLKSLFTIRAFNNEVSHCVAVIKFNRPTKDISEFKSSRQYHQLVN